MDRGYDGQHLVETAATDLYRSAAAPFAIAENGICRYHSSKDRSTRPFSGACTVFSYERHMYVALAVVVIAIVAVVSMVVLDIPIPFLSK